MAVTANGQAVAGRAEAGRAHEEDGAGLSPRAARTRRRLMDAALAEFEEQGFASTTVDDIVQRCGVARGTFYLYFKNRQDIFVACAREVLGGMHEAAAARPRPHQTRWERIEDANRAYLSYFAKHKRLLGEFLTYAQIIPEVGTVQIEMRDAFTRRIERSLRDRQRRGIAREMDPVIASYALGGTVYWLAFDWLARESVPFDESALDAVVRTLTQIWYHAEFPDSFVDGPSPRRQDSGS